MLVETVASFVCTKIIFFIDFVKYIRILDHSQMKKKGKTLFLYYFPSLYRCEIK